MHRDIGTVKSAQGPRKSSGGASTTAKRRVLVRPKPKLRVLSSMPNPTVIPTIPTSPSLPSRMGIGAKLDPDPKSEPNSLFIVSENGVSIFQMANGFYRLQDDFGYVYQVSSTYRSKGSTHWRCQFYRKKFKCKATVITEGSFIVRKHHDHNHPAQN